MPGQTEWKPSPSAFVLRKRGVIWVVVQYWLADGGGAAFYEVAATFDTKPEATDLGDSVLKALKRFFIATHESQNPPEPTFAKLAGGHKALPRFLRGLQGVALEHSEKIFTIRGWLGKGGAGFSAVKGYVTKLPDRSNAERVGQAVLDMFDKLEPLTK